VFADRCVPVFNFFPDPNSPFLFPGFPSAVNVALDVCTPNFVSVAVFTYLPPSPQPLLWSEPDQCARNDRITTVQLPLGQCVPVITSSTQSGGGLFVRFVKLVSVQCDPPAGTQVLVLRRRQVFSQQEQSCIVPPAPFSDNFFDRSLVATISGSGAVCNLNISWCGPFSPGCSPSSTAMSILTTPSPNNAFTLDFFNNNLLSFPSQSFAGCGSLSPINSNPNYLFSFDVPVPVSAPVSSDCIRISYTNSFFSGRQYEGVRLFSASSFSTSRTAPATSVIPPDSSNTAQIGVVIGSVGLSFAVLACCAMGLFYWKIKALLPTNTPRVPDWGAKPATGQWAQGAVQPSNPMTAATVNP